MLYFYINPEGHIMAIKSQNFFEDQNIGLAGRDIDNTLGTDLSVFEPQTNTLNNVMDDFAIPMHQSYDNTMYNKLFEVAQQERQSVMNTANTIASVANIANIPNATNAVKVDSSAFDFDTFVNKLADVESKGNYKAYNKGSKAYGRYQFIPSTEKAIAKKLGYTIAQARTPEGQENMVRQLTNDNIRTLKKAGVPITGETVWWAHNLGAGGATKLYKGNQVSERNMRSNLPGNKNISSSDIAQSYKNHWKGKFV